MVFVWKMDKKISFGFNKVSKKSNIIFNKSEPKHNDCKVELIKCLEGQSIQLVEEKIGEKPLVIPMKDNRKTAASLQSLKVRQAVLTGQDIPRQGKNDIKSEVNEQQTANLNDDIENRAARELLAELDNNVYETNILPNLVLPVNADSLPLDGAKESTITDYDSIPISAFGYAMLRGMGWNDEQKKKTVMIDEVPTMRPRGMGLGADKAIKPMPILVPPEANEILEIKKGACVRILGGKHKSLYGEVEGLDDHGGRVIVKMSLGGAKESFNEFMLQAVSKKEYAQHSKCINSQKCDEYKRNEERRIGHQGDNCFEDTSKRESGHRSGKNTSSSRTFNSRGEDVSNRIRKKLETEEKLRVDSSSSTTKHRSDHSRLYKSEKQNKHKSRLLEDVQNHKKKANKSKRTRSRSKSRCRK